MGKQPGQAGARPAVSFAGLRPAAGEPAAGEPAAASVARLDALGVDVQRSAPADGASGPAGTARSTVGYPSAPVARFDLAAAARERSTIADLDALGSASGGGACPVADLAGAVETVRPAAARTARLTEPLDRHPARRRPGPP
ncbi:MAG TPA: hypothetical protein VM367_15325, partial [Pseudonocardia sp.]|nr:hypothetical protein [Pseudonocardia sp.]